MITDKQKKCKLRFEKGLGVISLELRKGKYSSANKLRRESTVTSKSSPKTAPAPPRIQTWSFAQSANNNDGSNGEPFFHFSVTGIIGEKERHLSAGTIL
jgi:hypothetical protein